MHISIIFGVIHLLISDDLSKVAVSSKSTIQSSCENIKQVDLDLDGDNDFNTFNISWGKSNRGGDTTNSYFTHVFNLFGVNGTKILYKIEDKKKYALFSNQGDIISLNHQQNLWTTDTVFVYQHEVSKANDNSQVIRKTWQNTSYSSSNYIVFKLKNGRLGWAELGHLNNTESIEPTIIAYKLSYGKTISVGL